jgi:hypothetical protein
MLTTRLTSKGLPPQALFDTRVFVGISTIGSLVAMRRLFDRSIRPWISMSISTEHPALCAWMCRRYRTRPGASAYRSRSRPATHVQLARAARPCEPCPGRGPRLAPACPSSSRFNTGVRTYRAVFLYVHSIRISHLLQIVNSFCWTVESFRVGSHGDQDD